ncbi:MAG: hypothetical protein GXP55_19545 [Deltaproteobacteria bacterium]|nr:hypothetical protein [Deltaproteobacteria bacterium]
MTRLLLAMLLACVGACSGPGARCPAADLHPPRATPAFALVTSDYASSAIALLDEGGELLTEAYLDSGSASAGLASALSGDLSLPTEAPAPDRLLWLDRFGVDVVGEARFASGRVRQLATTPSSIAGEAAYRANPHDVLRLADGRWAVSRYEPNLARDARELDRGDDLLLLEPTTGELVGRIGLEALDLDVDDAGGVTRTYARPDRMLLRQGRLVVGLARLSADFRVAAPGAIALVDVESGEVALSSLPGLIGCGELAAARDDPLRVFVACVGPTFSDVAGRRVGAGVASLRVPASGPAVLEWIWRAEEHPDLPPATHALMPLEDDVVFVASMGDAGSAEPDRLLRLRLRDGRGDVVYSSAEAFTLGPGALSSDASLLLVPDASAGVLRFTLTGDQLSTPSVLDASPCRRLPARELRAL